MGSRYICLVSGELFENDSEAGTHCLSVHNLSLKEATSENKIMVEVGEDEDPDEVYNKYAIEKENEER